MTEDLVSKVGRQPGALAAVGQQQGEGGRGDPVETGAKGGEAPHLPHLSRRGQRGEDCEHGPAQDISEQISLYHDSKITP